ncbi:MAG TPA: hypothetical protein VMF86_15780 [Stellaceae bacterium]|nr:hypothetical protein [Stellaceae bacterium]
MAASFDTLDAAKRLKEAGAAEPLAETIAEILRQSRDFDLSQLATKPDLDQLRHASKADLAELKVEILKWIVGLMIAQTAAIVALVRLLLGHG